MKLPNNLLKLFILSAFEVERGRIRLFKHTNWIMRMSKTQAITFQKIGEKNGGEFLYKLGYDAGMEGSKDLIKKMGTQVIFY